MSTSLIYQNLIAYSLQIGLLVAMAAIIPAVLRLRQPGAKLVYWQLLLAVCVLLPLQPWTHVVATGVMQVTTAAPIAQAAQPEPAAPAFQRYELVLLVLLAGMAIRLIWLGVGFWKLGRYRRHSQPLHPAHTWSVEASLRISDDVASPVTFGWRNPVVLLPGSFPTLEPRVQEAILCHEVMHVRRRDWLFTVAEELVRAVFWFHPAIWWLLGEIGLAREQEVDRLAIEITKEREEYMDALLAIAGARAQFDLAPAPLFLRKRHLKHRVILILKEARMSKAHLISTLSVAVGVLAAACWLVTGAFPLTAEPQVVYDGLGVSVNTGGAPLMHRTGVDYPLTARQQGVQGSVSVEVKLDGSGNVVDARVLSGPEELRRSALQSVLQWHFGREVAGTTRVVQIAYELPKPGAVEEVRGVVGGVPSGARGGVVQGVLGGVIGSVPMSAPPPPPPPPPPDPRQMPTRVSRIMISGLPDSARTELLSKLPFHEGDELTTDALKGVVEAVKAFDEHLVVQRTVTRNSAGQTDLMLVITTPGGSSPARAQFSPNTGSMAAGTTSQGPLIKVGGAAQSLNLISKVTPVYPTLAKSARVSGVVHLAAIIGPDGTVQELHSLGGPALLIQSAMDSVRQWVYRPTLLNGSPVAVETTIDVNFTLDQ